MCKSGVTKRRTGYTKPTPDIGLLGSWYLVKYVSASVRLSQHIKGATENARHENAAQRKMQGWKMQE